MTGSAVDAVQSAIVTPPVASRSAGGTTLPVGGNRSPDPAASKSAAAASAELSALVRNLNEYMTRNQRSIQFRVDEGSGRTVITVVNPETLEVVRQIPSEEMIALSRWLDSSYRGALVRAYA